MNAQANPTGGRWYAKAGVDQMVSDDTTVASLGPSKDGGRWFVFADTEHSGDAEADANLLAAAKDLLEQLQHAVRWFDQLTTTDVARYRAVIAKATGARS